MHSMTPPAGGELARLARENRRLRRQTDRAKVQLVRQRGLGRLGPEALAAALDELRAKFVANGATPAAALARGHAAAAGAGSDTSGASCPSTAAVATGTGSDASGATCSSSATGATS